MRGSRTASGLLITATIASVTGCGLFALVHNPEIVIHDFERGLAGVHAASSSVRLSVLQDSMSKGHSVLVVEYPARTADPAGRDVRLDATHTNWTAGRAIAFRITPDSAVRLSVSFFDRNHVVWTAWRDFQGPGWQSVRIPFDSIQPNPFFQPPGAKTGQPIDVSEVAFIAFAPQTPGAGRFAISRFVVVP